MSVAAAIARRFGLPSEAIAQRMAQGRFRVKSNVDRETADRFAVELEALGAKVSLVDATTGETVARAAAPRPAAATEVLPAAATGALGGAEPAAQAPESYASGLAAAFQGQAQEDLGLGESSDSFSLATIDGDEDRPAHSAGDDAFGPTALPSEDMFRPPDDDGELEVALDLAGPEPDDDGLLDLMAEGDAPDLDTAAPASASRHVPVAASASRQVPVAASASRQVPVAPAAGHGSAQIALPGAASSPPAGSALERARAALAQSVGKRVAAGAMIAVLIGFIPALLVGAVRNGAYDTPRDNIARAHETYRTTAVATPEDLAELDATLDAQRADQLAIMADTRSSIALTAGVAWLLCSGGVGFYWFRKIDWDRYA